MVKVPNWDVELVKFADAMRGQALLYGFSDCVMMAAGAVEVQTGRQLTAEHAGQYDDADSARAYMHRRGWSDVDDVASHFLVEIDTRTRTRGDILMHIGERGKTLGICLGRSSLVMTLEGAMQIPAASAVKAWRVE